MKKSIRSFIGWCPVPILIQQANLQVSIIMTDCDTTAHIQILLSTFFSFTVYTRPLIDAGCVYIAMPPSYRLQKGAGAKTKISYGVDG